MSGTSRLGYPSSRPEHSAFTDQVIVVTGAAQGIGRAIADAFHHRGARTAYVDIKGLGSAGVSPYPTDAIQVECDVSDERQVDEAIAAISRALGPVAVLVNNAGIVVRASVDNTTTAIWERTLAVNLTGAFFMTRRVLPVMKESGYGRIVHIVSPVAITGGSGNVCAYAASKAGLIALTRATAVEYGKFGITSNAVAPAWIDTGMFDATLGGADQVPMKRLGTPEDVVGAVLYLSAPASDFVTGHVLNVDGGLYRHSI